MLDEPGGGFNCRAPCFASFFSVLMEVFLIASATDALHHRKAGAAATEP